MTALSRWTLTAPRETPLVEDQGTWIKPESQQLSGSVKYRLVYGKLRAAIDADVLTGRTVLVEASSGSTALALAEAGRELGLRVEAHVYAGLSREQRAALENLGARLVTHPFDRPFDQVLDAVRRTRDKGGWWLGQFERKGNIAAYAGFAEESLRQLEEADARPEAFVCPVGTGGVIQALGSALRRRYPKLRVIALEPAPESPIAGLRNTDQLYLGPDDPYERAFPDERALITAPRENLSSRAGALGISASATLAWIRERSIGGAFMVAAS